MAKAAPAAIAGTGIAPDRLEHDIGFDADGGELFGHQEPVLIIGHDDRAAKQRRIGDPANGILKRRVRTKQRQELLRPAFARRRPQPGTGAAAHDQGNDLLSQGLPKMLF